MCVQAVITPAFPHAHSPALNHKNLKKFEKIVCGQVKEAYSNKAKAAAK